MWPDLIAKAKKGGLDVIQTYVFWNAHEPVLGQVCAIYEISKANFLPNYLSENNEELNLVSVL